MLNYIIYYSFSRSEVSSSELEGILRKARDWNQAHELTGFLIYRFNKMFKRGNFLQIIEGPKNSILLAWERISADPRHHTITVLEDGNFVERNFSAWSMGLKNLDTEMLREGPGLIYINYEDFWANAHILKATALELLRNFYDMG